MIFVNDFDWLLHFHDLSPGVRVVLTPGLAAPHKGLDLNGAVATKQPAFHIALPEDELDKMLLDLLLSHQVLPESFYWTQAPSGWPENSLQSNFKYLPHAATLSKILIYHDVMGRNITFQGFKRYKKDSELQF